jgi:hypothetical protein
MLDVPFILLQMVDVHIKIIDQSLHFNLISIDGYFLSIQNIHRFLHTFCIVGPKYFISFNQASAYIMRAFSDPNVQEDSINSF